jgi:phosphatidylglycerophosphate synthase
MRGMNAGPAPSYATIRRDFQPHLVVEDVLVDYYAKTISPFLTRVFVVAGVAPNAVTILMILFGIAGACVFAIPPVWCKVCGLVLIHFWYVLDCSDGEVARITKRFSKFGAELDFTAHVVCHPLFNLAFALSLVSLGRYSTTTILFVSILSISSELILRNQLAFQQIYSLKMQTAYGAAGKRSLLKQAAITLLNALSMYPNFALVFPIFFLVDYFAGTSIAFYYLCLHTAISTVVAIRASIRWVRVIAEM